MVLEAGTLDNRNYEIGNVILERALDLMVEVLSFAGCPKMTGEQVRTTGGFDSQSLITLDREEF